ncbi:MAG: 2,3-bisphosphoglycerate-dependent phosphoglycerate mutase [Saprospiraceae bacterium]
MKQQTVLYTLLLFCFFSCTSRQKGSRGADQYEKGITIVDGKVQSISSYHEQDATIFYLVRHAEKEKGEDPGLTSEGTLRAEKLAKILEPTQLSAIYSTNLKRTINTASPSAGLKNLEINSYDARQQSELVESLISRKGEQFLIVGHSNSIPGLLNLFQKKKVYKDIRESEFDNIYIVMANSKDDCKVIELKF